MIRRLLVANRGEIARRVFATCRAMGIETVAVYSDADADAPHASEAGRAVRLPGNAAAATYLRADLLIDAALRTGADAQGDGDDGLEAGGEAAADRCRSADARIHCGPRGRHGVSGTGQSVGRWRRAGHAHRPGRRGTGRCGGRGATGGGGVLRRRYRLLRAVP